MVPDAEALLNFYSSEFGPFELQKKNLLSENSLLIDCSTIGPVKAIEIHALCKSK